MVLRPLVWDANPKRIALHIFPPTGRAQAMTLRTIFTLGVLGVMVVFGIAARAPSIPLTDFCYWFGAAGSLLCFLSYSLRMSVYLKWRYTALIWGWPQSLLLLAAAVLYQIGDSGNVADLRTLGYVLAAVGPALGVLAIVALGLLAICGRPQIYAPRETSR